MTATMVKEDSPWTPCAACAHSEDKHGTLDGSCSECICVAFVKSDPPDIMELDVP